MTSQASAGLDFDGEPLVCRPGEVLAGYEIVRFLNSGGSCQVFEAEHTLMQRRVAIKLEKARLRSDPTRARRILGEARALARLDHPNVIRIHQADVDERVGLFIVMELLTGQDLRGVLERMKAAKRTMPIERASSVALQLADALDAFHRVGVLHRDLKPENVFVTKEADGHGVKLLDLGLAKFVAQPSEELKLVGTASYMAPEQLGGAAATHRSEIFSLGIVLYELLTGEHPYSHGNGPSTLRAQHQRSSEAVFEPLNTKRPDASPVLTRFVAQALAKLPEARPASMSEFRRALEQALRAGHSALANLDETAPLGFKMGEANECDSTAPFGPKVEGWAPSGAEAPHTDLGASRATFSSATPTQLPPKVARVLPPFACELNVNLGSASLVLIEAPGAWRFMRIPVLGALNARLAREVHLGSDTAIPIPALPTITLRTTSRGKVSVEGPVEREQPGELKPYDSFRCGAYRFQLVPPTPDGLGIPVDYRVRTVALETPLEVPSLLVRSGALDAILRRFPLRNAVTFVGGAPELELPLFRCHTRIAARLTIDHPQSSTIKVERATDANVRLHGKRAESGLVGPGDVMEIEGWEFEVVR